MASSKDIVTPIARLSFPSLFEPRQIGDSGAAKYQATLLIDPAGQAEAGYKALKDAAHKAAIEKWGANNLPKKLKTPFKTIDELENVPDGYTEEHVFIRMNNTMRPGVVDRHLQKILDSGEVYAGCYVIASTHAYAWAHPSGGKGVSFSLDNIMKVRDGEPFGNRTRATDAFAGVELPGDDDAFADIGDNDDSDIFG